MRVSIIYAGEPSSELIIQDGHKKVIHSLSFSPDGNIIASGGLDRTIRLWDAHDMSLLKTLSGHTGSVNSIAISHDGRLLASGGDDKTVRLWDIEKRSSIAILSGHNGSVFSVAFSPEGDILISASDDATIGIWDVNSLTPRTDLVKRETSNEINWNNEVKKRTPHPVLQYNGTRFLTGHNGAVYAVTFSPDGRLIASGGADETIKLWDREKMTVVETLLEEHERGFHPIYSIRFSSDGEILATAGAYPNVHLWDIKKKIVIRKLYDNSHAVYSVAFSPKGKIAVSGGWDTAIKLWDITTGTKIYTFENHIRQLYLQFLTRDGKVLTIGSWDKAIKIWDIRGLPPHPGYPTLQNEDEWGIEMPLKNAPSFRTGFGGELKNLFEKQDGLVESVALSDDSKMLAAGYRDNTVKIWDFEKKKHIAVFKGHENWPICIDFSPGGRIVASGGLDRTVRLWDIHQKTPISTLRGHNDAVKSLSFSTDGNILISTGWGGEMIVWDINLLSPIDTFKEYNGMVHLARFSPDGNYVAIVTKENTVLLLSIDGKRDHNFSPSPFNSPPINGGELWKEFSKEKVTINSIAFSPDGHLLAIGDGVNTVGLWDLSSKKKIRTFAGHTDSVYAVMFYADGKRLVSGSEDHSIKVWDIEKGIPLITLFAVEKDDFLVCLWDNSYIASEGAKRYLKK